MTIIPTVGRIVWFYFDHLGDERAAIVTAVHADETINVHVFTHSGQTCCGVTKVRLVQEGERRPEYDHYCTWMPYQIGQAKKHEKESTGDTATETT